MSQASQTIAIRARLKCLCRKRHLSQHGNLHGTTMPSRLHPLLLILPRLQGEASPPYPPVILHLLAANHSKLDLVWWWCSILCTSRAFGTRSMETGPVRLRNCQAVVGCSCLTAARCVFLGQDCKGNAQGRRFPSKKTTFTVGGDGRKLMI